jgi:carbonic anhydrase-like protein
MLWGSNKKLAVAVTCSDWRLHQRKVDFNTRIGNAVGCGRVDMVVLPGPDGLLLAERAGEWAAAQAQTGLLAKAHHAVALAVVAHQRCAGHPVDDGQHEIDVAAAAKALKAALDFEGPAYALVATYNSDSDWGLKTIGKY